MAHGIGKPLLPDPIRSQLFLLKIQWEIEKKQFTGDRSGYEEKCGVSMKLFPSFRDWLKLKRLL